MKPAIAATAAFITGAAAIAASALGQSATPSPQLLRTQTAFDIVVHLPYAEAAPLFGPEGERPWAGKHWNPQFLYPQPAHDEQGAVFTIHHGPVTAVWVNTLFDLEARHFQYAYFIPDIMVTTIDVHFTPVDASSTSVHVVGSVIPNKRSESRNLRLLWHLLFLCREDCQAKNDGKAQNPNPHCFWVRSHPVMNDCGCCYLCPHFAIPRRFNALAEIKRNSIKAPVGSPRK
jgi:hypothetical protein